MTASADSERIEPRVSRRGLLTSLPVLAAAGAGAVALSGLATSPASAGPGDPVLQGANNNQGATTTTLTSTNAVALDVTTGVKSKTLHVGAQTANDDGDLSVLTNAHYTAFVKCRHQVTSDSETGGSGVYADGFMAPAIVAEAFEGKPKGPKDTTIKPGLGIAVRGHNTSPGITVATQLAFVFEGLQSSTTTKVGAAAIVTHGLGRGLLVESTNTKNTAATITGANAGPGIGVVGVGSASGRGGSFAGGKAQARLVPAVKAGTHPASGLAGDLFVDAKHRLWFCKGGAAWVQIA